MTKQQKQMAGLGGLGLAIAVVLYIQFAPGGDESIVPPVERKIMPLVEKQDVAAIKEIAKTETDQAVMLTAVGAAAQVGGADAIQEFLTDKRKEVRSAAVAGLGTSGSVAALPTLEKTAKDPDPGVRVATLQALNNIDDFKVFDQFIAMLNDPDVNIRRAAHQSIESRIGLMFPDYKADGPSEQRGAAIAKIKTQVSKMKSSFDQHLEFQKKRRAGQ